MTKNVFIFTAAALLLITAGCRTEHRIEVAPMEVNLNVNVNVKVDKALDDFFGDLDNMEANQDSASPTTKTTE
ncbi:YnbE family lipoprotein [Desulfatibacillum aliphaticivorans]|uniref:YnbE family lipoprotein n=1 Tax=Desulfatibacillum aliphaticivorans TaxID=218208 RepID=UPI00042468A9|nr:YnbE family lipoprotein [Desulfatibacillum aliphaticivorans]